MEVFDVARDDVIKSTVIVARTNYADALQRIVPLIDRFDEQRKLQRPKFYDRLEADIVKGCIMPPITLAFVQLNSDIKSNDEALAYINSHIEHGYILDGMQRLNTLKRARTKPGFDPERFIYLNIIIAEKYDLLLYRMITLNNGQKPMTVRHQIEMLTRTLIEDVLGEGAFTNITILSEKETEVNSPRDSFRRSDIVSAYTAFLSDSPHNQNSRIIEEKLDEILVGKVMDANRSDTDVSFVDILREVDRLSEAQFIHNWLRNENNLIGFTIGAKRSLVTLKLVDPDRVAEVVRKFESAFAIINPSKVNVGRFRRELSQYFFERFESYLEADLSVVEEDFLTITAA